MNFGGFCHFLWQFQIQNHYDNHPTKVEMSVDKLQLIATTKVSLNAKAKWVRWWNGSERSRKMVKFPPSPCYENALIPWLQ